jgi:hypothetical protein
VAARGTAFSVTAPVSGAATSGPLGTNGASSGSVGDATGLVVVVTGGVVSPVSGLSVVLGVELVVVDDVLVVDDVVVCDVGLVVWDVVVWDVVVCDVGFVVWEVVCDVVCEVVEDVVVEVPEEVVEEVGPPGQVHRPPALTA